MILWAIQKKNPTIRPEEKDLNIAETKGNYLYHSD